MMIKYVEPFSYQFPIPLTMMDSLVLVHDFDKSLYLTS
jgi:hypothetical protein